MSNFFAAALIRSNACGTVIGGAVSPFFALVETHRVDARDDVVAQIRRTQTLRLQLRDDALHFAVDLEQARRPCIAVAQARRERFVAEAIDFFQKRAVRAAGEPRVEFVNDAERQQLRRFELRRVVRLALAAIGFRETARHADHFEALVLQVVRFLGVEREDPVRERFVG